MKIVSVSDTIFKKGVFALQGRRNSKPDKTNLASYEGEFSIINRAVISECYKTGDILGDTILRMNDTIRIMTDNSMCGFTFTSGKEYDLFADCEILYIPGKQKGKYLKDFYLRTTICSGTKEMDINLENDLRVLRKK